MNFGKIFYVLLMLMITSSVNAQDRPAILPADQRPTSTEELRQQVFTLLKEYAENCVKTGDILKRIYSATVSTPGYRENPLALIEIRNNDSAYQTLKTVDEILSACVFESRKISDAYFGSLLINDDTSSNQRILIHSVQYLLNKHWDQLEIEKNKFQKNISSIELNGLVDLNQSQFKDLFFDTAASMQRSRTIVEDAEKFYLEGNVPQLRKTLRISSKLGSSSWELAISRPVVKMVVFGNSDLAQILMRRGDALTGKIDDPRIVIWDEDSTRIALGVCSQGARTQPIAIFLNTNNEVVETFCVSADAVSKRLIQDELKYFSFTRILRGFIRAEASYK